MLSIAFSRKISALGRSFVAAQYPRQTVRAITMVISGDTDPHVWDKAFIEFGNRAEAMGAEPYPSFKKV